MKPSKDFNHKKFLAFVLALGIYGAGPIVTKIGPFGAALAHADEGGDSGDGSNGGTGGEGHDDGDSNAGVSTGVDDDNGDDAADSTTDATTGGTIGQTGGAANGTTTTLLAPTSAAHGSCTHDCHD